MPPESRSRGTLHVICPEKPAAKVVSRYADEICADTHIVAQFDQIILSIGGDLDHPYCKIPVFPGRNGSKMLETKPTNLDYPILQLSEAVRELESYALDGKAASLVSFSDGMMLAANSLNVRMSGIPLAQRMRLPSYLSWHLPGEFDRFAQEVLAGRGEANDHVYLSRKISDLKIYRYRVRTRAVRIFGYEGDLFRLSVSQGDPEAME